MSNEAYIQTRNAAGETLVFGTLAEAWKHVEEDPTVWKVSFALVTGERVRLVARDGSWVYEDITAEAIKKFEASTEKAHCQVKKDGPSNVLVIDSLSAIVPRRGLVRTYGDIAKTIPDPGKKDS